MNLVVKPNKPKQQKSLTRKDFYCIHILKDLHITGNYYIKENDISTQQWTLYNVIHKNDENINNNNILE